MIPAATYFAKATGPLIITKAKTGSDRAIVPVRITKGDQEGQMIDFRGSLNEGKALEITTKALEAFGYDFEDPASVMKNEVQIVVEHRENPNDGKVYAEIKFVNDMSRASIYTPADAATTAAARARLKAAKLAAQAAKPASGNPDDEPRF